MKECTHTLGCAKFIALSLSQLGCIKIKVGAPPTCKQACERVTTNAGLRQGHCSVPVQARLHKLGFMKIKKMAP